MRTMRGWESHDAEPAAVRYISHGGVRGRICRQKMDALNRESYALFNGAICEIKQIVNRETYKLNKFLTYT